MKDDTEVRPAGGWRTALWRWPARVVACLAVLVAGAAGGGTAHTVGAPGNLAHATDRGPVSSSTRIELTIWLKPRDSAGLDRTLAAQRTGGAGWLSDSEIDRLHAPNAVDVATVSAFLKARGLAVTGVGPHNLFVKASGTAAIVDAAFHVQLHQYTLHGTTFHASRVQPTLPAGVAPLVVSVGGLSNFPARPTFVTPHLSQGANTNVAYTSDFEGLPPKAVPLAAATASPAGVVFSTQCFFPPTTVSFTSDTATATYSGGVYGASISNTAIGTLPPCGYSPSDLHTAYNLTPLYQQGLDGTGETIAIVDAYGSITLQQDVAAFSAVMGLPPANVQVIGTPTGTAYSSDPIVAGWAEETMGDVEWAHAIAPGANIVVVLAPSQSLDDLVAADLVATQQPGVAAISNSWAVAESTTDFLTLTATDNVLKLASSQGISVNYASGDSGNNAILSGGYTDVDYPASSPYATGVGGVSLALDQSQHILFQTAWGTNAMYIAGPSASGNPPEDPPVLLGFIEGGGGGVSGVYPLPSFQASLREWGTRRLVPDISWLADPFTGVELVYTLDAQGDQFFLVGGGTSAATPMFSALWAIAAQKAKRKLGQAAPLLYTLPPGAITDVLPPVSPPTNVTGTLTDPSGTSPLAADILGMPLQGQATFRSALYNSSATGAWFVITFGTDSTLRAAPGWDPATGLGTPNGVAFVDALSH